MHVNYPEDYILRSAVEWCPARFELETEEPLGEQYRIHCPSCKQNHDFRVIAKHD